MPIPKGGTHLQANDCSIEFRCSIRSAPESRNTNLSGSIPTTIREKWAERVIHSIITYLPDIRDAPLRTKLIAVYVLLIGGNALAWVATFITFRDYPILLGTAFLAYALGLRHAVDPDHIAAIDNVTRKLMQEGQRPVSVGLFFSLGHSTVVILASAAIAATSKAFEDQLQSFREVGGIVGTSISSVFLLLIAGANLVILWSAFRASRRVRCGGQYAEEDAESLLMQRGLLGRLFRPVFKLVAKSWHMYPLGFLFGLGFDTATEIGLLGISAAEASRGLPIWSIMMFPALFTAGMSLVDTSDGVLMLGAYGWSFKNPTRKLHYNLTITAVSVLVALVIGGVETLGLIADKTGLVIPGWSFVDDLSEKFGLAGYVIVAAFAACWLVSALTYYLRPHEKIARVWNSPSVRRCAGVADAGGTELPMIYAGRMPRNARARNDCDRVGADGAL